MMMIDQDNDVPRQMERMNHQTVVVCCLLYAVLLSVGTRRKMRDFTYCVSTSIVQPDVWNVEDS